MSKLRDAAQQALEALKKSHPYSNSDRDLDKHSEAIHALRSALAEQPAEQEPVAWIDITDEGQIVSSPRMYSDGSREERPLYTSPQPRRRLTDEEIDNTTRKQVDDLLDHIYECGTAAEGIDFRVRAIARAIEAAVRGGGK